MEGPIILFFDGHCNLCNYAVNLFMKMDKKGKIKIASLQGDTAKRLGMVSNDEAESIILLTPEQIYTHDEAVFQSIRIVGGFWKILLVFELLPKRWTKRIYDVVAARRYRWFGKRSTCRMPTPEERERFLP
jgi:predicted DCC family thiol-disulfide oxidoreductase YuxK